MTLLRKHNNDYPVFPSFFDNLFSRDLMDWSNNNYSGIDNTLPAVNVKEDEDQYCIEVAAPGMVKKDFNVKLENDLLVISSEKKDEKNEENETYSRKEFSYQSFKRTFTLPQGHVNSDKIEAKYDNGILKLTLPKRDEVKPKPAKEIEII